MEHEDLPKLLAQVIASMLERGCPCRYPRFRASCERASKDLGALGYTTWEQTLLVTLFESKVPRRGIKHDGPNKETGFCGVCGAAYVRTSQEYFAAVINASCVRGEIGCRQLEAESAPAHAERRSLASAMVQS